MTRAERRAARAVRPAEGVYGVDVDDAGADSWIGRYLCWAASPAQAGDRVRAAGFRAGQVRRRWTPAALPEPLPQGLGPGTEGWFRSRRDDGGWTGWVVLPRDDRHPSQARAAVDPRLR